MGNGFEALKPLATDLKSRAREREEQSQKEEKVQTRIARDTLEFLQTMHKTGVKRTDGVKLGKSVQTTDIDFSQAMTQAGVRPIVTSPRPAQSRKKTAVTARTNPQPVGPAPSDLSDDADPVEFIPGDDGMTFRHPDVGPDVPRDLRRGRWCVVGQIDLHGMFVEEARDAVVKFLLNAQATERLCVRIVHGKGNGSPDGQSVLREKVRRWLKQREEVLAFAEPREAQGGAGATLVRLKSLKNSRSN